MRVDFGGRYAADAAKQKEDEHQDQRAFRVLCSCSFCFVVRLRRKIDAQVFSV